MIKTEEANGFLAVVYEMMERMTREDRKWFIKACKMAKTSMDLNYPNGKPVEAKPEVELIKPVEGIIVPGGSNV